MAVPGDYVVELRVGENTMTQPLHLDPDPRVSISAADLDEQLRFSLEIRDAITRLSQTVVAIRDVHAQLQSARERLGGDSRAAELVSSASGLLERADAIEDKLHNTKAKVAYDILELPGGAKLYSKLGPLMDYVNEGDGAPTQGLQEVFTELRGELDGAVSEWEALVGSDLGAWNEQAKALSIPYIVPPSSASASTSASPH